MKQARINCPKCGAHITVRDAADIAPENQRKIFAAADAMFKSLDEHFKKIFDRKLWGII